MTTRRRIRRGVGTRHRPHSLAPQHIGETGSVALVAMGVGGIALFITGLTMLIGGLTMAARYAGEPPPNVGELGRGPLLGGIGLTALSIALLGTAVAVVADVRRSRRIAAATSGLAALLAAVATGVVMLGVAPEPVLVSGLAVATVVFAGAALLLIRPVR